MQTFSRSYAHKNTGMELQPARKSTNKHTCLLIAHRQLRWKHTMKDVTQQLIKRDDEQKHSSKAHTKTQRYTGREMMRDVI
jgi:hypothetical protein